MKIVLCACLLGVSFASALMVVSAMSEGKRAQGASWN